MAKKKIKSIISPLSTGNVPQNAKDGRDINLAHGQNPNMGSSAYLWLSPWFLWALDEPPHIKEPMIIPTPGGQQNGPP